MLERRVMDYLTRMERGTVRAIPESFDFANPDRPYSGRLVVPGETPDDHPGLTFAEAGDRTDVAWIPPRLSTASRTISLKSMRSVRGHIVDFGRNQVLMFESILEFLLANILMAQPDVRLIEDQPPAVKFFFNGKEQRHTFDYRTTATDGYRVAYEVKPSDQLERDQTTRKVDAIREVHSPAFANIMRVCTEAQITRDKGWNAVDINDARKGRVQADCDDILERLRSIGDPIEIWRLQERVGEYSSVWNALLCLLFDGFARISTPGRRFSDASRVQATRHH